MFCLGIESTAHTFGIGIVSDKGEILADAKDSYKPPLGWGMKPTDAAAHHERVKEQVLEEARKQFMESGHELDEISAVAYSQGPGLPPCLHIGHRFAAWLAERHKIPLLGVNHCVAHIEIGKLATGSKDPIVLYVSGGNTQVIAHTGGRYRVFGESQDIGVGNALDKFGREAGLEFPAGPKIEELAKDGKYLELPYVVKGMDLSFSGIVTDASNKLKTQQHRLEDLCFSLQETCFAMLVEVTERALAHAGKTEVLVTGGVAANKRLVEMLDIMCKERGAKAYYVPLKLAGDNGVMIAWTGMLAFKAGVKQAAEVKPLPRQRTDDVDIMWIKD